MVSIIMKKRTFTQEELEDSLYDLSISNRSKKVLTAFFFDRYEPVFLGHLVFYGGLLLFLASFWIMFISHKMEPSAKKAGDHLFTWAFWIGIFTMSMGRSYINRARVRRAVGEIIMGEHPNLRLHRKLLETLKNHETRPSN